MLFFPASALGFRGNDGSSYTTDGVTVVPFVVVGRVGVAIDVEVRVPGVVTAIGDWGPEVAVVPDIVQRAIEVPASGEVKSLTVKKVLRPALAP